VDAHPEVGTIDRDAAAATADADVDALRDACTRFLTWHGARTPADLLAEIALDTVADVYGKGGVVQELEEEVAELLGKPAAVFFPSGTMGQQATLRVHADRRGRRVVLFHPACHLDRHEEGALERVHGLIGRPVGDQFRLITLEDLQVVAEPPAALLLELPQRDLGGQLPAWDDLVEQVRWAREQGAAVHMDGARLWDCPSAYGRDLAEIADLFDTVYVSFYKGLGGITGCCVAGPEDIMAEVSEWRTRHGGRLFALWPYAASDLAALRLRGPRVPTYVEHARAIADAIRDLPGLDIVPDPPQTSMMHLLFRSDPNRFRESAFALAKEEGIWTWSQAYPTTSPQVQAVELQVGDGTLAFTAEEVRDVIRRLLPD
jgi:threonine aldolase